MTDSEKILAKIEIEDMELYFTDKRLIFISTQRAQSPKYVPIVGGLAGGAVGSVAAEIIFRSRQNKKTEEEKQELRNMSLDEKAKKNKGSFAIPYDDVDEIVLSKARYGGQAHIKAKNVSEHFAFNKEQFSQLAKLLPALPLLKGKYRNQ